MGAWRLRRHLGEPMKVLTAGWMLCHGAALAIMSAAILAGAFFLPYNPGVALWRKLAWVFVSVLVGAVVYGLASWKMGCPEWKWVFGALEKEERTS